MAGGAGASVPRLAASHAARAGSAAGSPPASIGCVNVAMARFDATSTSDASSARRVSCAVSTPASAWLDPSDAPYSAASVGPGVDPKTRYPASDAASGIATRKTGFSSSDG